MTHSATANHTPSIKNILSIAGSDPSGGAGIQADLKSIAAAGGYGMAVISALTAQNTRGVRAVHVPPASFLTEQLTAISADIHIDAIKIGMLANAEVITALGDWLNTIRTPTGLAGAMVPTVILDPVMIATSGDSLLDPAADAALRQLFTHADVITPNIPELGVLARGAVATTWEQAVDQARALAAEYQLLVLAKGGHLEGTSCRDALIDATGALTEVSSPRLDTQNTHGTGCSLSAALATHYAHGGDWPTALTQTKTWLTEAITRSDDLRVGHGHGPLNHLATLWDRAPEGADEDPMPHWWEEITPILTGINQLSFITELSAGTLALEHFEDYLGQDALYLRGYASVMSKASALAPDEAARRFWAASAASCLEEELALHRGRLGNQIPEPSTATDAYLNHLSSSAHDYPVLVAALLPCFWIYQDVGRRLAAANHPGHPYADWLSNYASEEFDALTREAINITRDVLHHAEPSTWESMWRAFEVSSLHELAFFAQTGADTGQQSDPVLTTQKAPAV